MRAKVRELEREILRLKCEIEDLNLTLKEMYFYGLDLVERVRMEPVEANELRVASQTKKGLVLIKCATE